MLVGVVCPQLDFNIVHVKPFFGQTRVATSEFNRNYVNGAMATHLISHFVYPATSTPFECLRW